MKLKLTTGDAVKTLRKQRGLNQSAFWSPLGVTQSGGSRYEAGRDIPKPVQLLLELAYGTEKSSSALLVKLRGEK